MLAVQQLRAAFRAQQASAVSVLWLDLVYTSAEAYRAPWQTAHWPVSDLDLATLVAVWLSLQPQHLGTAALLFSIGSAAFMAQPARALQRKLRESSPALSGNSLCPCQLRNERLCLGQHINHSPAC